MYTPPPEVASYLYAPPSPRANRVAGRTAVVMWSLGALLCLLGVTEIAFVWSARDEVLKNMVAENQKRSHADVPAFALTPQVQRVSQTMMSGLMLGFGGLTIGLGFGVRRGSRAATIGALVAMAVPLLFMVVVLVLSLLAGAGDGVVTGLLSSLVLAWIGGWLVRCLRVVDVPPESAQTPAGYLEFRNSLRLRPAAGPLGYGPTEPIFRPQS